MNNDTDINNLGLSLTYLGAQVLVNLEGTEESITRFFTGIFNCGGTKLDCELDFIGPCKASFRTEPKRFLKGLSCLLTTKNLASKYMGGGDSRADEEIEQEAQNKAEEIFNLIPKKYIRYKGEVGEAYKISDSIQVNND